MAYRKHEGIVAITLNPRMIIHLIGLRDKFTKMILENGFSRLRQFSSQYLYEIMKSAESPVHYEIGLDAFKARILAVLKKRVLEPALAEINTLTDTQVSYEPVRQSQPLEGLRFIIKNNNRKNLELE